VLADKIARTGLYVVLCRAYRLKLSEATPFEQLRCSLVAPWLLPGKMSVVFGLLRIMESADNFDAGIRFIRQLFFINYFALTNDYLA